jgi:hypothetical protein
VKWEFHSKYLWKWKGGPFEFEWMGETRVSAETY